MKITRIETLVCHARMRNWIFVKVHTDQPGLWGWGEATLEWHTRAVLGAIEDIAPLYRRAQGRQTDVHRAGGPPLGRDVPGRLPVRRDRPASPLPLTCEKEAARFLRGMEYTRPESRTI
jgi:hypothetical protein